MKKQFIILSALIILIAGGCSKDNELKKSVFIPDKDYPDLPAYSEWGYNTFGFYYDREAYTSNDMTVPAKIIVNETLMTFTLNGGYVGSDYDNVTLTFKISGYMLEKYSDLLQFNHVIIDLTNPAVQVWIKFSSYDNLASILRGELIFQRVQNLLVDKKQNEVILSGFFEFQALINSEPITVSDGRFDVGIGPDNFYVY
jgi:hypothetical protein